MIGYDAWLENFIERFEMAEKFPDFPSKESEEVIKSYLTFIKAEPYNAVDFEQGKLLSDHDSNYVIKYAGGISIYYMSKKNSWSRPSPESKRRIRYPKILKTSLSIIINLLF